ncbi:MAG: tyrosine-type recombinase/integrase [Paludibacteraceae bacterium]|nr:tyrosine-type recombinase/integrase [Paludibacteraceae bacterium]
MINDFLTYLRVERKYSPRTVTSYGEDLQHFCAFLARKPEELEPDQVGEDDVRTWMMDMLEERQESPRTVRRRLSALHSFYRYLLRKGLVKRDVTRLVIAPKVDKPLPVFFRESEMREALAQEASADDYESIRDNLILELLYQTGMRQAEMLGLEISDIDFSLKQIRIFGKRRKERIVPLGDKLLHQLSDYLQARTEWLQDHPFAQSAAVADRRLLLRLNKQGEAEAMSKYTLYSIVRARMGEVSTLRKHSPHVLRHTFATTMLDHGADIRTIQTLMGHASLAATQVYTHTTFEQIRDVYNHAHPRAAGVQRNNHDRATAPSESTVKH